MDTRIVPDIKELHKRVMKAMDDDRVELEAIISTKMITRNTFVSLKERLNNDITLRPLNEGYPIISLDISTIFVSRNKTTQKEYTKSSFERASIYGKDNIQRY